jgi:hypothetical protein
MKIIKIPSKALKMPCNRFEGNKLVMYNALNTSIVLEIEFEETYTETPREVDAKAIEIIKAFGDGVEIEFKEKHLFIKKDKNTCKCLYQEHNIKIPEVDTLIHLKIAKKDLSNALKFTASESNNRVILQAINISDTGISATDGFKAYFNGSQDENENVSISKEFVSNLLKITEEETVKIYFNKTKCWAFADNMRLIGNVYNDTYPKVNDLKRIGEKYQELKLDPLKVKEAISLLKIDNDSTAFEIISVDNVLYFKTEALDLEVGNCDGDVSILFSKEHLFAFNLIENATVYYSDSLKPIHIKNNEDTTTILVVPMRKV